MTNTTARYRVSPADLSAFEDVVGQVASWLGTSYAISYKRPWVSLSLPGWTSAQQEVLDSHLWQADSDRGYSGWVL